MAENVRCGCGRPLASEETKCAACAAKFRGQVGVGVLGALGAGVASVMVYANRNVFKGVLKNAHRVPGQLISAILKR